MKRLLSLLLLLPLPALADTGLPNQPYIYVEGKAEIVKPADLVTLNFELSFMDLEAGTAYKLVQEQAVKVFALCAKAKIAESDLVAGAMHAEEEREDPDDTEEENNGAPAAANRLGKFLGYRVTRSVAVTLHDVAQFPKIIDDLLALKVHTFTSVAAGLSNAEQLEEDLLTKAVADARARAEKTLKAAGAKPGTLFAVSPVPYSQVLPNMLAHPKTSEAKTSSTSTPTGHTATSIYKLAPVTLSQRVHVIYLLDVAH